MTGDGATGGSQLLLPTSCSTRCCKSMQEPIRACLPETYRSLLSSYDASMHRNQAGTQPFLLQIRRYDLVFP